MRTKWIHCVRSGDFVETSGQCQPGRVGPEDLKDRAKYFNIGFVKQSLTSKDDYIKYKSEAGVNITWGKTYYLHKKPLWGMVKIGLDWSWMDFNYVKYSSVEENFAYDDDFGDGNGFWKRLGIR